jgi:cob(I)alamin adenosyltransferase
MTKIYTKGGDKGQTGLFSGERIGKDHPLVNAYGTVDELNSVLGLVRSLHGQQDRLEEILHRLQNELFECGADMASGGGAEVRRITDANVERLEGYIDELTAGLPELRNFILPAGHPAAAALHLARTVGRRAERAAVAALEYGRYDMVVVRYLNRLADLLFVLAREANRAHGLEDELWSRPG